MDKIHSLICLKSALTYVGTVNRRKKLKKPTEDFSEINLDLKCKILSFVLQTLMTEMNISFRGMLNEILFLIVREGQRKYLELFVNFCSAVTEQMKMFIQQFVHSLLNKEQISNKITM